MGSRSQWMAPLAPMTAASLYGQELSQRKIESTQGQPSQASTIRSEAEVKLSIDDRLSHYFTASTDADVSHYTDGDIAEIAHLLRLLDSETGRNWGTAPRLYIVLRRSGLLDIFHEFSSNELSDTSIPFSDRNLPPCMDALQRRAFIHAQHCILTADSGGAQCERGQHCHFADDTQIPFRTLSILGTGGYSQVEKVRSTVTGIIYARKMLNRRTFSSMRTSLPQLEAEIATLKKVRHRHIVEVVGSYTDPHYANIIMTPVADCDLAAFLKNATGDPDARSFIPSFFGCLATALHSLHGEKIRHKDIKPQNVLVKNSNILLTDFGLARDCNDRRSTTEGWTAHTRKYCSPEVADYAPRSYSSDMWSLGCIFLEMLTVLQGIPLSELQDFFASRGTCQRAYCLNEETVPQWLHNLRETARRKAADCDDGPYQWINQLLQHDREARPSALAMAFQIANHVAADHGPSSRFCGLCCRMATFESDTNPSVVMVLPTVESSQTQVRGREEGLFVTPEREDASMYDVSSPQTGFADMRERNTTEFSVATAANTPEINTSLFPSPRGPFSTSGDMHDPTPPAMSIAMRREMDASPSAMSMAMTATTHQEDAPVSPVPLGPLHTSDDMREPTPSAMSIATTATTPQRLRSGSPLPPPQHPQHRYFLLRSSCEVDIETSNAHDVWTSEPNLNKRLDEAFRTRRGRVFLIFAVSRRYVYRSSSLPKWMSQGLIFTSYPT